MNTIPSKGTGHDQWHPLHLLLDVLRPAVLLAIPALAAWVTGRHMIFPSLGATAFILGVRGGPTARAWSVIGGYLIGVVSGMIIYHALVRSVTVQSMPGPMTWEGLRLVIGAMVALTVTITGMLVFRARHAPACSATLLMALGLLDRWIDGPLIMASVIIMYAGHRIIRKSGGLNLDSGVS